MDKLIIKKYVLLHCFSILTKVGDSIIMKIKLCLIAGSLLLLLPCCDNRQQTVHVKEEIIHVPDVSELPKINSEKAEVSNNNPRVFSQKEFDRYIEKIEDIKNINDRQGVVEIGSISNVVETNNELSNENYLITNLKELFIIKDKENLNPMEHDLLKRLVKDSVLTDLSGIKSISNYLMRDKSKENAKYGGHVNFQIWVFDNKDYAKWYFDVMKKATWRYDKPPKCFFIISGEDKLYYFSTWASMNNEYMYQAYDKLISCCFSRSKGQSTCGL